MEMSRSTKLLIKINETADGTKTAPVHCVGLRADKIGWCWDLDKKCPYKSDKEAKQKCEVPFREWKNNCLELEEQDHLCTVTETTCPWKWRAEPSDGPGGLEQCHRGYRSDEGSHDARRLGTDIKAGSMKYLKKTSQEDIDKLSKPPTSEDPEYWYWKEFYKLYNSWSAAGNMVNGVIKKESKWLQDEVQQGKIVKELITDAQLQGVWRHKKFAEWAVIMKDLIAKLISTIKSKWPSDPSYLQLITIGIITSDLNKILKGSIRLPHEKAVEDAIDAVIASSTRYTTGRIPVGEIAKQLGIGEQKRRNRWKAIKKLVKDLIPTDFGIA